MAIATGLQYYHDKMVRMTEHYDDFIMARTMKQPNIWHDRIPRGAYKLYSGLEQKTNIYRGGLGVQAGLNTWTQIGTSRKPSGADPGFDNCAPRTPQRYKIAWETTVYKGFEDSWQSDPLCVNDLKFNDAAKQQVALYVRTGVEFGISIQENWNREQYVLQALLSNRGMMLATGALEFEDNATYRFDYDPYSTVADADGNQMPYMTFDANLELSTLNWEFIDYIRHSLAGRAGEAALSWESGMPVYGLMIDIMDFERMVKADDELRKDWREADAKALIAGYGMGVKMFRGMGIIHDQRQMRFAVKGIDAASGKMVATRVAPEREGRAVTIGNIPEPNPAYYRAEIGIGVVFMNDVIQNLFVPTLDNLGSGAVFGPAPGLSGEWKWINIQDNNGNQFGESGYFLGRFQIFPKPLLFASDCTVFAYRRCAHALRTVCEIQSHDDVGTGAIAISADAVAGDFDLTNRRITLTTASLLGAGVGDTVTIKKADANTFTATLLSDSLAPKYVFGWASGATDAPTAYTDFTAAVTTVTA